MPRLDMWSFMLLPIKTLAVDSIIVKEECELIDGSDTIHQGMVKIGSGKAWQEVIDVK